MTKPGGKNMFRHILIAGVIGGMIGFVLSALQNAVLPAAEPKAMPDQPAILAALRAIPQAGFYFFPGRGLSPSMTPDQKNAAQADYSRLFREGPVGVIAYSPGGGEFHFGRQLAIQLLLSVIAALAAASILAVMVTTTTYGGRVGIMCLLGIFAFVYLEPQYWNWYGFPATYTITRVFGGVVTWTISGAAMAAIVR
jgi:hypothetical protein